MMDGCCDGDCRAAAGRVDGGYAMLMGAGQMWGAGGVFVYRIIVKRVGQTDVWLKIHRKVKI
jgi:hypothetical protein